MIPAITASDLEGTFLAIIIGVAVVALVIMILVLVFLQSCLNAIPPQYRRQQPGMVWLLLIPLFNIVWIFFVYPRISESFANYFAAQGRMDKGDCGRSLAMTYCGLVIAGLLPIPIINSLIGIATLVVWIILLVKFGGYKKEVLAGPGTGGFPVQQQQNYSDQPR